MGGGRASDSGYSHSTANGRRNNGGSKKKGKKPVPVPVRHDRRESFAVGSPDSDVYGSGERGKRIAESQVNKLKSALTLKTIRAGANMRSPTKPEVRESTITHKESHCFSLIAL